MTLVELSLYVGIIDSISLQGLILSNVNMLHLIGFNFFPLEMCKITY